MSEKHWGGRARDAKLKTPIMVHQRHSSGLHGTIQKEKPVRTFQTAKKILRYIERQKRGQDWNNSYLSLMTDVQNKSPAAITTRQTATVNTEATGCCTIRS